MFDSIKSQASRSKGAPKRSNVERPRTVAFVGAIRDNGLRLSYAALADASEALGEHKATGMSAGQRGAKLLGSLPIEMQPYICNGAGGYRKGMEWDGVEVDIKTLRKRDHVRPEAVHKFVQAFIKATASDESVTETDDADDRIDELDDAQDAAFEAEASGDTA